MVEEILAVKATIEAAEIQKWGMIWAAIIGGAALGVGVFVSWLTSLHLQRVARLAETRKVVYLELVEAYSDMHTAFHLLLSDVDKNWPKLTQLILDFGKKAAKTMFICETKTKLEIVEFLKSFDILTKSFFQEMVDVKELSDELNSLSKQHTEIMQKFNEASNILHRIKIEDPSSKTIPNIFKYFDEQIDHSNKHIPLIENKEKELIEKIQIMQPFIQDLAKTLDDKVVPISHMLRSELGAKTNVNLDMKIQSELNK